MKEDGRVYYIAQALADKVLGEDAYNVLENYKGTDLEYKEYEHCTAVQPFMQKNRTKKHFMLFVILT